MWRLLKYPPMVTGCMQTSTHTGEQGKKNQECEACLFRPLDLSSLIPFQCGEPLLMSASRAAHSLLFASFIDLCSRGLKWTLGSPSPQHYKWDFVRRCSSYPHFHYITPEPEQYHVSNSPAVSQVLAVSIKRVPCHQERHTNYIPNPMKPHSRLTHSEQSYWIQWSDSQWVRLSLYRTGAYKGMSTLQYHLHPHTWHQASVSGSGDFSSQGLDCGAKNCVL